jgi:LuxR family maltose regulon positive regulatory protein
VARLPLVLVVAPAGAGKTSLLSGWTAESELPSAWLSLEETHGEATELWSAVISALETLSPHCGERARSLLQRSDSVSEAVIELLAALESGPGVPAVLVIDDLHLVDDADAFAASLSLFVQHLPSWLHVALASRRAPNLPLDRLRARGRLGEVHFAELRFAPDEARELLRRLAPSLSEEQVVATAERADGWVASLQLAALAARAAHAHHPDELPDVEDATLVQDYVLHEVLAAEPPDLVECLLDISVVDRVNPSLARALTRRADARALLLRAEARGLFVARLGSDGWFEVQSLVREALITELETRSPSRLAEQHVRAARWYENAGEVPLALEHWLAAGRPRNALRLLAATNAALYDAGHEATIRRTIAAIPADTATADIESMLQFAWCHLLLSRRQFVDLVDRATWWAERSVLDPTLGARLTMLRAIRATVTGHSAAGGALARDTKAAVGDGWWRDPVGRFAWNLVAREVALSEAWDDAADEVRQADLALGRDPERRLAMEATRALGEALAGRPVDALRASAGVRHAAAVPSMTVLRAELALAEAVAHREIGDRQRARSELHALSEVPAEPMLYCRILAGVELVQLHLDEGDVDAARLLFEQMDALAHAESFGVDGRNWIARAGTLVALAAGEHDGARHWAKLVDDCFWAGVGAARVDLADGKRAEALSALQGATPRCARHDVVLALLRARAVENHEEAVKTVAAAVEEAATYGMLQTVASEGSEVVRLVEAAAWRAPPPWMDRLRRLSVVGTRTAPAASRHAGETLTDRERDVLRFLPSRLTLGEIADELFVSVNTLKFHLKVIYRKLGVSSRAEAAEVARRMALGARRT